MSSVFDHLHLKRNTAGSSNELSFDVLDAARGDLDSKRKRRRGTPEVLKPVRTAADQPKSFHGAQGASTLSGQVEVTRRKRERRSNSLRFWAVGLIVAVGFILGAAYMSYDYYQDMQEFRGKFQNLVEQFVAADECLPQVEGFVADPFSADAATRGDLKQQMAQATLALDLLKQQAAEDVDYALNEDDNSALMQVIAAADAREDMFSVTEKMISIVIDSNKDESELSRVWNDVMSADQQARTATGLANRASTDDAIQDALEKTASARDAMQESLVKLQGLDSDGLDFDVSQEIAYLQKRIESLDHAINTGTALLAGDKQWASYENEAYNTADQEAVKMAEDLPQSLGEAVKGTYSSQIQALRQDYEEARNAAIQADALIRAYVR